MRSAGLSVSLLTCFALGCGGGGGDVPDDVDAALVDAGPMDGTPDGTPIDGMPASVCGDRSLEPGEECDDGNTTPGDGCDSQCAIEVSPTCGDSNVDFNNGEQCDDGNAVDGDGCDSRCQLEAAITCGDGNLDIDNNEECDDGDTEPGDGCSPTCQFELVGAFCGDGALDPGEICDDGNIDNGDGCNSTCNFLTETQLFVGMPGQQGNTDGIGTAGLIGGFGALTTDEQYLWLADSNNRVVRRITVASGTMLTVAGNGNAVNVDSPDGNTASFAGLEAITTDGNIVWVGGARRIRAVQATQPFGVTTVAGNGTQGCNDGNGAAAQFDDVRGLTYYGGQVWFLDANCATVRRFDPATGDVVTVAGMAGQTGVIDGIGTAARFISPRYMATDNSGMLYIADTNGATIRALNTVTLEVTTFAGDGTQGYLDGVGTAAQIHRPRGMTSDGTSIYWVEFNQHTIRQADVATRTVTTMVGSPGVNGYVEGTGTLARLDRPYGVTFHFPSRSLFFIDSANHVIRRIQ